ncbi:hypothetical protein Tco_0608066 [Tanacetum coccineum]|uniref:Reverse transcriptase RNase H-like domain-containing protein n=1 Tax=Tanacetum coccineum TaxID=301880 RepID=A0ABQ5FK76_9ASTR
MRQVKLVELLKDYDTNIQYHPGKANVVADALSRKSGMIACFDSIILRDLERLDVELCVRALEITMWKWDEISWFCYWFNYYSEKDMMRFGWFVARLTKSAHYFTQFGRELCISKLAEDFSTGNSLGRLIQLICFVEEPDSILDRQRESLR